MQELVGFTSLIPFANGRFYAGMADFPLSPNNGVPSQLRPVPAFVSIHRKITAHHRGDLRAGVANPFLDGGKVVSASSGRGVPTVSDRVGQNVFYTRLRCRLH